MKLSQILKNKDLRIEACRKSKYLFFLYYFTDYFLYPSPEFHKTWAKDFEFDGFKYYINLGFRESAKTTYTKMDIIHNIVYEKKNFIMWISHDRNKAEGNLFDIAIELQENKKLIADFGMMFKPDKKEKNKVEKKSVKEFITENKIKVLSYGTKGSLRGLVYGKNRPDLLIFDDIENNETKLSTAKTRSIINFIDETVAGLAVDANIIVNCNYISEFGVVRYLLDKEEKSDQWRKSWIDVAVNGVPMWHSKYALTSEEANKRNKQIKNRKKYVVSLEEKREELGAKIYDQEMMNKPIVRGERWFDVVLVDKRIQEVKGQANPKNINEWKMWGDYNKDHRYAIGADVAQGVRADSAVIQIYDFTDEVQVGEFVSDETDPRMLGKEMVLKGIEFGSCILCPENNTIGKETIREIQDMNYQNMHIQRKFDREGEKLTNNYGWQTDGNTKTEILVNFRDQFEKGMIEINSLQLLYEMRAFTRSNLRLENIYDEEISNHFDRVMAFAIVLMMRNYAKGSDNSLEEYEKAVISNLSTPTEGGY